jgi:hypothetical protein
MRENVVVGMGDSLMKFVHVLRTHEVDTYQLYCGEIQIGFIHIYSRDPEVWESRGVFVPKLSHKMDCISQLIMRDIVKFMDATYYGDNK